MKQILANLPKNFFPSPNQYKKLYSGKGIVIRCFFCKKFFVITTNKKHQKKNYDKKIDIRKTRCPYCKKKPIIPV